MIFSRGLNWNSFIILLFLIHGVSLQETGTSTTEATDASLKSSNSSDTGTKNTTSEVEWRSHDAPVEYNTGSRTSDKIYSIDLATLHKYRRNGIENSAMENEENRRRYYSSMYPDRNQLDTDPYYQQREKSRYSDEIYPVRIQTCAHQYMRDVNRFQNNDNSNQYGVLQGWLGGSAPPPRWNGKNTEQDKRGHESTPSYITTATAKIPTSQNRYQNSGTGPDYPVRYNYDSRVHGQVKSRQYNTEYRADDLGAHSRGYFNNDMRNRDYNQERSPQTWGPPTQRDRNNRIIYYEYNLDDRRAPPSSNPSYYQREQYENNNCGFNYGLPPCVEPAEVYINRKTPMRNNYEGGYSSGDHSRPYFPPSQSRALSVSPEDNTSEPQQYGYVTEDSHRFKYVDQNLRRQPSSGTGQGYVYSLDLPRDRQQIPGSAPSIYMSHFPFSNSQFLNDEKYDYKPTVAT